MKRLIIIIVIAFLPSFGAYVNAESKEMSKVNILVKEYSVEPDFQVLSFGRLGLSFVKALIKADMDKDTRALLAAVRNVKRITIASYEDCDSSVKDRFASRLSRILDKDTLLLQAKDSGETVEIYGDTNSSEDAVTDLIINAPSSGALICIKGSIPMSEVARILESKTN
jgi:hypothetical protein